MRDTYTAVGPVDVEEREGEESLVAFFGEELLFELDKIGFQVDHFWRAAVRPATQATGTATFIFGHAAALKRQLLF